MKNLILAVLLGLLVSDVVKAQIPSLIEIEKSIEKAETYQEKAALCIQFSKQLFASDLGLSMDIATDAIIYADKAKDSELLIRANNNVGNLSRLEGNLQLANQYYRKALDKGKCNVNDQLLG